MMIMKTKKKSDLQWLSYCCLKLQVEYNSVDDRSLCNRHQAGNLVLVMPLLLQNFVVVSHFEDSFVGNCHIQFDMNV